MDWKLRIQVLEVRFTNGFRYLDKAGEIGVRLCERHPQLTLDTANLRLSAFDDDAASVRLEYNHEKLNLTARGNGKTEIKKYAGDFFAIAFQEIGISNLTRVGNLNTYVWTLSDKEDANGYVKSMARGLGIGPGIIENADDVRLRSRELHSFRLRYDSDTTAMVLSGETEDETIQVSGPYAKHFAPHVPSPSHHAKLSADIFTKAPMSARDFDPDALLDSNEKMLKTRILAPLSNL